MFLKMRKSLITLLTVIMAALLVLAGALTLTSRQTAYAYTNDNLPTGDKVINLDDDASTKFSEAGLNQLAVAAGYTDLNNMMSSATAEGTSLTDSFTDKVVRLGKDTTTGGSELKWVPVYLSRSEEDKNGDGTKDAILTLWLANDVYKSTWSDGTYSTSVSKNFNGNTIYSNTYDGSFIRHKLNGKTGWTTSWETGSSLADANDNIRTLMSNFYGSGTFAGYVTTPAKVSWQANANYMKNDPAWNNTDNSKGTGENYPSAWINDNVWLPSMYEVCDSTIAANSVATSFTANGGLWQVNKGNICSVNNSYSWLRSGSPTHCNASYRLYSDGSFNLSYVNYAYGVRPALHINLESAAAAAIPKAEVTVGNTTTPYSTIEQAWQAANSSATAATVTMLADATIGAMLEVSSDSNVTLDLNGYMLKYDGETYNSVIKVRGTFTLEDNYVGTDRTYFVDNPTTEDSHDTVEIVGGVITGGHSSQHGGGVMVASGGIFTLNSGTIAGNEATYMDTDNYAHGGGVFLDVGCSFTMNGGAVSYNNVWGAYAGIGGGVFAYETTTKITGGTISHNKSSYQAGGLYAEFGSLVLEGGVISHNKAPYGGGMTLIGASTTMKASAITGNTPTIENNTANYGGGIYFYTGTLMMEDGAISGNQAQNAGGVYLQGVSDDDIFKMKGGEISGNTVTTAGGGVYYSSGKFAVEGAVNITGNKKGTEDNNVYVIYNTNTQVSRIITVSGALVGAQIGFNLRAGHIGVFTSDYGTHNKDGGKVVAPSTYFISDVATVPCVYLDNNNEVGVGNHTGGTATCTQKAVCTNCGAGYGSTDSSNHTPSADDGNCTTAITCSGCGTVTTAAQSSHDFSGSYTSDGAQHWHVCTHSGCNQTDTKTAHTAGEWIVDTAAQVGVVGSKHKQCTVCEYVMETEAIPALQHTHTYATDWSNDESGHWHAATCEHTTEKSEFATHNYGEWIVDAPAQIGVAGSKHKDCAVCGYRVQTEIEPLVDKLVKPGINGGKNQVIVTAPNGFMPDIKLVVTQIAQDNYAQYETIAERVGGKIELIYDVTLKSDGVIIQPDGTLTIKLLIPENLSGKTFKVFHLHEGTATDMKYTVDGTYAVLNTNKLSEFIFVGEKAVAPAPDNNANGLSAGAIAGITIGTVLVALIAAYVACYFTLYRKGVLKGKAFDVIFVPMNAIFKKKQNG